MSGVLTIDVTVGPASPIGIDVTMDPAAPKGIDVVVGPSGGNSGGMISYAQLPDELRYVPISFPFSGRPEAGTVIHVPMAFSLTVPMGLTGTVTYAATKPNADATFIVNRISGDVVTELGMVTVTPVSSSSNVLSGVGGELAVGDVLQIVMSSPTDAELADLGITILTGRE